MYSKMPCPGNRSIISGSSVTISMFFPSGADHAASLQTTGPSKPPRAFFFIDSVAETPKGEYL
ncbi:MAG: hypothetical protein IPN18_22100 [Ignavibacteriales bacterium]|nr:hypothetical protein [Ignavibacteriales bacterium]